MITKIAAALICAMIVSGCTGTNVKWNPVDWNHDTRDSQPNQ